jgi:hypothetical protein
LRSPRAAGARGWRDEATPDQVLQRILAVDRRQARDPATAPGDDHLAAPLNALEMLAQPIVKLADPYLVSIAM